MPSSGFSESAQTKRIIIVNTLQSRVFLFQVKELKAKIEEEKGQSEYPVDSQKLIYGGKIMVDEDPLSKYEVDEKKFIVVMVAKKAAAPAAAPAPPSAPESK